MNRTTQAQHVDNLETLANLIALVKDPGLVKSSVEEARKQLALTDEEIAKTADARLAIKRSESILDQIAIEKAMVIEIKESNEKSSADLFEREQALKKESDLFKSEMEKNAGVFDQNIENQKRLDNAMDAMEREKTTLEGEKQAFLEMKEDLDKRAKMIAAREKALEIREGAL